ncbi:MAG: FtsX-like permease family protein [Wenzhouxiangellaceae bacterium]|nr:FtsX-like permease family protein [Wenzhouxiangellaceae bacterium]
MLTRFVHAFARRQPAQFLLAVAGIAAGIAVVTGVALLRGALLDSLDDAATELAGTDALIVRAERGPLPVPRYAELARMPGAPDWVPVIREAVRADGVRLEAVGIDAFSAARRFGVDPAAPSPAGRSGAPAAGTVARTDRATLDLLGLRPGDRLTLDHEAGPVEVVVQPLDGAGPGLDRRLVLDIADAQAAFGRRGTVDELLAPASARRWILEHLPEDLAWRTADERRESARQLTSGMRANLAAMSLLALATGLFVVYSVLNFLAVQRRPLFATLRGLGLTPRRLAGLLLVESLVLGLVGSAIGVVLGTALADLLLALIADPVNEIYGQLPLARSDPSAGLVLGIVGAGLVAAMLVAVPIVREALDVPPGRMAHERRPPPLARRVVPAASALVAAGAAWVALDARLVAGLGGLFLVLAGLLLVVPALGFGALRIAAAGLGRSLPGHALTLLGAGRHRLAPGLAALTLALALSIGMGAMILGFRTAVDDWVAKLLRADLYVSATTGSLDAERVERLSRLEGVAAVSTVRDLSARDGTRVTAYRLPEAAWGGFQWIAGDPESVREAFLSGRAIAVSEPFARRRGLSVGDELSVPLPLGERKMRVAGVFRDYSTDRGFIAVDASLLGRARGPVGSVGLYLADDASRERVISRLAEAGDGRLDWITPEDIRSQSLAVFDRTFRISWAMAVLVACIALVALVSALLAHGLERAREYATLRALGLTPRRLGALVVVQTLGLACAALALAVPLAIFVHYALTLVIQPRAFGWSLPATLPPAAPFLWVAPSALALAALAGLAPAWRVARRRPAEALRGAS